MTHYYDRSAVVTGTAMKELDRIAIEEHGVPSMVLMERAALACVRVLYDENFDMTAVVAVCGTGNNGGDGIAIARLLHLAGVPVTIVTAGDPERRSKETRRQQKIADSYEVETLSLAEAAERNIFTEATTVVDAVFGIGLSRAPEGEPLDAIRRINRAGAGGAEILAVDIASGLSADTGEAPGEVVSADLTVTFAYKKTGHTRRLGEDMSGEIFVEDIGIY